MKASNMERASDWLLTSSDVGSANRARVMRLLYRLGPQTRTNLADLLDVSRATVHTVVQPLVESDILVELPARSPGRKGGKPTSLLWFGAERVVGSIYLSADECIVALVQIEGRVAAMAREPVVTSEPQAILELIQRLCDSVFRGHEIAGIGVAFAGIVDTVDHTLLANYRMPSLSLLPVGEVLTHAYGVPVFVSHHPRVQAFGDSWIGMGRGLNTFGSVVTGEVLGLGIVRDGTVIQGMRGAGGEAGHMVVDMNGDDCPCGRRGCWETIATLRWLRDEATRLQIPGATELNSHTLLIAADTSPTHRKLAQAYARNIGLGLANLEQVMGLGTYILHGDVASGGEKMRQWVEETLVKNSPRRQPPPRVLIDHGVEEATLLGGAALVLSHLFPPTPTRRPRKTTPPPEPAAT